MDEFYSVFNKVYIYSERTLEEFLAEHVVERYEKNDKAGNYIGSKTKHTLKNIRSYPAGVFLSEVISMDENKIKDELDFENEKEVMLPYPLDSFSLLDNDELIYTINCISAIREFVDLLDLHPKANPRVWLDAFYDFAEAWDFTGDIDVQIRLNKIYEGCSWWESEEFHFDEEKTPESQDFSSLKFDAACLKDILPGLVEHYDDIENYYNENPDFAYHVTEPVNLLFRALEKYCDHSIRIKKCKNCGMYFVPANRSDTLYCDRMAPQDETKTCKEYGARKAWEKTLQESESAGLYRKLYMSKQMLCKRNLENPEYASSFDRFKTESKRWKAEVKTGTKTEAEFLEWLKAVKEKKVL